MSTFSIKALSVNEGKPSRTLIVRLAFGAESTVPVEATAMTEEFGSGEDISIA